MEILKPVLEHRRDKKPQAALLKGIRGPPPTETLPKGSKRRPGGAQAGRDVLVRRPTGRDHAAQNVDGSLFRGTDWRSPASGEGTEPLGFGRVQPHAHLLEPRIQREEHPPERDT